MDDHILGRPVRTLCGAHARGVGSPRRDRGAGRSPPRVASGGCVRHLCAGGLDYDRRVRTRVIVQRRDGTTTQHNGFATDGHRGGAGTGRQAGRTRGSARCGARAGGGQITVGRSDRLQRSRSRGRRDLDPSPLGNRACARSAGRKRGISLEAGGDTRRCERDTERVAAGADGVLRPQHARHRRSPGALIYMGGSGRPPSPPRSARGMNPRAPRVPDRLAPPTLAAAVALEWARPAPHATPAFYACDGPAVSSVRTGVAPRKKSKSQPSLAWSTWSRKSLP